MKRALLVIACALFVAGQARAISDFTGGRPGGSGSDSRIPTLTTECDWNTTSGNGVNQLFSSPLLMVTRGADATTPGTGVDCNPQIVMGNIYGNSVSSRLQITGTGYYEVSDFYTGMFRSADVNYTLSPDGGDCLDGCTAGVYPPTKVFMRLSVVHDLDRADPSTGTLIYPGGVCPAGDTCQGPGSDVFMGVNGAPDFPVVWIMAVDGLDEDEVATGYTTLTAMTYDYSGDVPIWGTSPTIDIHDGETDDGETAANIVVDCTNTATTAEDCDMTFSVKQSGAMLPAITIDGDAGSSTASVTANAGFVAATTMQAPAGGAPVVTTNGRVAVDTTASQLVYGGAAGAVQVLDPVQTLCVSLTDMADQDNYPILTPAYAVTLTSVGCYCSGTCTNEAAFALEDKDANAIGTAPDCATTTNAATFTSLTADSDGVLVAGEVVRFDQTNGSLTTGDDYSLCVTYTVNRQ
jgi:hypothetical protein